MVSFQDLHVAVCCGCSIYYNGCYVLVCVRFCKWIHQWNTTNVVMFCFVLSGFCDGCILYVNGCCVLLFAVSINTEWTMYCNSCRVLLSVVRFLTEGIGWITYSKGCYGLFYVLFTVKVVMICCLLSALVKNISCRYKIQFCYIPILFHSL